MERKHLILVLLMVSIAVTGTGNGFSGRIRAETLGKYNFVVSVCDSVIYFIFNSAMLGVMVARGSVTKDQLAHVLHCGASWEKVGPWKYLAIAGVSDVVNNVTGMAAQPHLTTLMMSLCDQATTPFTVLCSLVLLGTRYNVYECMSVVVVVVAAVCCVVIAHNDTGDNSVFWAGFAAITTAFAALSFVLKEMVFRAYSAEQARKHVVRDLDQEVEVRQFVSRSQNVDPRVESQWLSLEGDGRAQSADLPRELSVFVVGAIVSFIGLVTCVPVALMNQAFTAYITPDGANSVPQGMSAIGDGLHCLVHCENALGAYLTYAFINILFNLSLLLVTGYGSALLSFLSLKSVVPLTAVLSPLPWPIIGSKPVSVAQWALLIVMSGGIAGFRYGNIKRERSQCGACCWPLLN